MYLVAVRDLRELQDTVRGVGSGTGEKVKNLYTIFNEPGDFHERPSGWPQRLRSSASFSSGDAGPALSCSSAATTSALLVAGFLGMYPIGQRFLVFLLPIVVLCLAEGIAGIAGNAPRLLAAGLLSAWRR